MYSFRRRSHCLHGLTSRLAAPINLSFCVIGFFCFEMVGLAIVHIFEYHCIGMMMPMSHDKTTLDETVFLIKLVPSIHLPVLTYIHESIQGSFNTNTSICHESVFYLFNRHNNTVVLLFREHLQVQR